MMTTATKLPPLGTRAWEVEWCPNPPPTDECGDWILDACEYQTKVFATEAVAQRFARKVYPMDVFGSVRITPVELSDPYGDRIPRTFTWDAIGDGEFYDGED